MINYIFISNKQVFLFITLKKKINWFFFGIKLYNLQLLCPTLFLKEDFCRNLYEQQKEKKNHVSLEKITHDFILLRTVLILKMEQIARDCFLLGISQVAFQGFLGICNTSFFNYFISQTYLFWILKNKSPFIACLLGFSFFIVNKKIVAFLLILLTKCILFFYTKIIEFQQFLRDLKKTKAESKNSAC